MRIAVAAVLAVPCWAIPLHGAPPVGPMVKISLEGQPVEGTPLACSARRVHLLGRDGRLWTFHPNRATTFRRSSRRFRSYTTGELRAALLRELGKGFAVTGTSHYLVAHPRGQRDRWARRFEDLYRAFVHYFAVRGLKPAEPPFPLIGVVCRDQREFRRHVARASAAASADLQGLYDLGSNRIILYDMQAQRDSARWRQNASVIIHEAAHQTAFNTGVHSRFAPPPLWVAEGLATMFEAAGVYDSYHHTRRKDRINRGRFRAFRQQTHSNHGPTPLEAMIASDRRFRTDPAAAYAEAWAFTFYLVETQPRRYASYLGRTARRPPFTRYTPAQRTGDFVSVFGDDWPMLQARFLRFMAGLR